MYEFLDRFVSITLPRIRDFRGVSPNSFDGRGNYTMGLPEQIAFPEIDFDRIDKSRGLEMSFVTTAKNDEEGRRLLALLGMPFAKTERAS
jgi:large subunit ribosomal protein L5